MLQSSTNISFIKKDGFFKKPVEREQYLVSAFLPRHDIFCVKYVRTKTLDLFFLSLRT